MKNKPDDKIIELIDTEDDLIETTDQFDAAFWDEFYKEKREKEEEITVDKKDDGIQINIRSKLPKIHTN